MGIFINCIKFHISRHKQYVLKHRRCTVLFSFIAHHAYGEGKRRRNVTSPHGSDYYVTPRISLCVRGAETYNYNKIHSSKY